MNDCCEHNEVCRYAVGRLRGDDPVEHLEHFEMYLDAFRAFEAIALDHGVHKDVIGNLPEMETIEVKSPRDGTNIVLVVMEQQ